jgi:hypothetical protein
MRVITSLVYPLVGLSLAYPGGNKLSFVRSVADTCTEDSQSFSYWKADDFQLKVYNWDNGGTTGSFGFRSFYSASNITVDCTVQDVDLAKLVNTWTKCNAAGTEFLFDLNYIGLTIRESWMCPGSPG